MKIAILALACSLLGTAAFAQDGTTAPAVAAQPKRVMTILVDGQPPMTVSLDGHVTDGAEFVFVAKKIISSDKTTILENGVNFTLKKQGKVLWSISVPEGSIILPMKIAPPNKTTPPTQAPK